MPVFVLTHHARDPQPMQGGTTFHFVTDGPEAALAQAREVAGDQDVHVAGGASAVPQYIRAGLLDELRLHVVPLLLGGARGCSTTSAPHRRRSSPRAWSTRPA